MLTGWPLGAARPVPSRGTACLMADFAGEDHARAGSRSSIHPPRAVGF